MGVKSSPHGCVKMQSLGEEVVRGNPRQPSNPFFYDSVVLNLAGSSSYDSRFAKVRKLKSQHDHTAGDMATYVDDNRTVGFSSRHGWNVSHRVGTRLYYLGIQDALRKRSIPSQTARAWTGALAQTNDSTITVSCTQDKWDKAKSYIHAMQQPLENE
jgi:hypothetical protein